MKANLNNIEIEIVSEEDLSEFLDRIDSIDNVEAWITSTSSSSLCLLKSGVNILLMFLENPEDVGVVSASNSQEAEVIEFTMANGQVDEFPLSWCIENEWAYKALAYFFENSGEQSPHIQWQVV